MVLGPRASSAPERCQVSTGATGSVSTGLDTPLAFGFRVTRQADVTVPQPKECAQVASSRSTRNECNRQHAPARDWRTLGGVKLHEAIDEVLRDCGRPMSSPELADGSTVTSST